MSTTTAPTVIPSRFGFFVGYRDGSTVSAVAADGTRHFGTPELVASADGVRVYSSPEGAGRALRRELLALLEGRHPEAAIVHGWDHAGAGSAIFGWWAKGPVTARYLGRTLVEATAAAPTVTTSHEIASAFGLLGMPGVVIADPAAVRR